MTDAHIEAIDMAEAEANAEDRPIGAAQTEARVIVEKLQDVVEGNDGWLNTDKAIDIIAAALAAKDAELAAVHQQYVDANEARIDAEAQLAEARKALADIERSHRNSEYVLRSCA